MSKGSAPTSSTVVQTNLPEYVQPYLERILRTGEQLTETPLEQFGGERIAGESPERETASEGIKSLYEFGSPYFGETMDATRQVIRGMQAPTRFTQPSEEMRLAMQQLGLQVPESRVDEYMSPYMTAVIERQKEAARKSSEAQRAGRAAQQVQRGAFGGSRAALQDITADTALTEQMADIEALGRQKAFEQASGQFERDRAAELARQTGSLAGLQQLAGLGERSQAGLLSRLGQLEAVGKAEEARRQLGLDQAYQEFIERREFPKEQLDYLRGLISGTPFPRTSTQMGYQSQNLPAQLLGLGITGLQLSQLFGR